MRSIETKFCSLKCEYAKPNKDVPGCLTFNPIYCGKYERIVDKGDLCLDCYNKK